MRTFQRIASGDDAEVELLVDGGPFVLPAIDDDRLGSGAAFSPLRSRLTDGPRACLARWRPDRQ